MNNTDKLKDDTKVFIDSLGGMASADSKREKFLLGVLSDTYYKMLFAQLQFDQALKQVVWPEESEIAELTKQRDELRSLLSNLLAVVHRDGGHYEKECGTDKAVNDAILKVSANYSVIDEVLSNQQ